LPAVSLIAGRSARDVDEGEIATLSGVPQVSPKARKTAAKVKKIYDVVYRLWSVQLF